MCIKSFLCVSYQQRLCLNWCQMKIVEDNIFSFFLSFFVCASGEDDSHDTYILLIYLKVVVTTVTRKSMDIKMYGNF